MGSWRILVVSGEAEGGPDQVAEALASLRSSGARSVERASLPALVQGGRRRSEHDVALVWLDAESAAQLDALREALDVPLVGVWAPDATPEVPTTDRPLPILRWPAPSESLASVLDSAVHTHLVERELDLISERFHLLTEHVLDILWLADLRLVPTWVTPSIQPLTGWTVGEFLDLALEEIFVPASVAEARAAFTDEAARVMRGEEPQPRRLELEFFRKDGSTGWIEMVATLMRGRNGEPAGIVGVSRGIDERRQAAQALQLAHDELEATVAERTRELRGAYERLRVSEERYALALDGANDGIWDWDLKTDQLYVSVRFLELIGLPEDGQLDLEAWLGRVHRDDRARFEHELHQHISGDASHLEIELRMAHDSGQDLWVLCRGTCVRGPGGTALRVAGSLTDVTARKRMEQQLLHDAFHDSLTGLPNRALCADRINQRIRSRGHAEGRSFAVLVIDLDRFKTVNDSLGHGQGDRMLISVANRLVRVVQSGDTLARLGGDEFAILVDDIRDTTAVVRIADRIQEIFTRPFDLDERQITVSASIGVAMGADGYESAGEMLRDAETAMYRAKEGGKARYMLFDPKMHTRVLTRLQLEIELREAIEKNQLRMHYQPLVEIASGRIVGFEALMRWAHPELDLVLPSYFIELAEETGLINPMGRWGLMESCAQLVRWTGGRPERAGLYISVNLSSRQLSQPDLVEQVREILDQTGVAPETLLLELTETTLMEHPEAAIGLLRRLKALGVRISVDDFGTGYSSLSYLQRLPVDVLKIDRSFVSRMSEGDENVEIVRAIVGLARGLHMKVIAEGVETEEQRRLLEGLRCELGQGYHFGRPLSAAHATELLADRPRRRPTS